MLIRRALTVLAIVMGLLPLTAAPAAAAPTIRARLVVGGLDEPVAFTFGPGRRIWYVEKASGEIRVHDLDTGADELFVRVAGVVAQGESGMLGIALHPRYPDKPLVYLYVTRTSRGELRNEILRYRDRAGAGAHRTVLLSTPASGSYHNGGRIAFGPDGMLYAIVGDAHDSSNAQDLSNEDRGKIIRIEPDGDIPPTNPFGDRIWAYGIRNSFGFAFDPETGGLWETENGPACNDEINRIVGGRNYGWGPNQTCEGPSPRNTNQDGPNPVLPALFYRSPIGITGIAFCTGCHLGRSSEGSAFFGAVNVGEVTRIRLNDARDSVAGHTVVFEHVRGTISFEVGPGGWIYFSDFDGIYRLVRV